MKLILFVIIIILIYYYFTCKKENFIKIECKEKYKLYLKENTYSDEKKKFFVHLLNKLFKLKNKLVSDKYKKENKEFLEAINLLEKNFSTKTKFKENASKSDTSFTINKGEEIVFCLKCSENLCNINVMLYVAIHELAHIACDEYGHTKKFWKINKFLLNKAVEYNIYKNIDYSKHPVNYCGIPINSSIIN